MAKKTIFYFEDESPLFIDYINALREEYDVKVSTQKMIVEKQRNYAFDLLILDVQIRIFSYEEENIIENLKFSDIYWRDTGIEFLRRIRQGQYERNGFPSNIQIIASTVRADQDIKDELIKHGISDILEKPFTIDELRNAIQRVI